MVGRRVGEKGVRNIKTYSKRKQKLVVCLAKQMLLLVSVKLCVLELRICLRKVSSVPFGYVLLEFAGRLFGAMLRQHRTGGQGEGKKAPLLPHEETDHCWLGKLILGRMSGLRKRNGGINPQQKQCIICLRTLLTEILEIFQQTIEFFIGRSLFFFPQCLKWGFVCIVWVQGALLLNEIAQVFLCAIRPLLLVGL